MNQIKCFGTEVNIEINWSWLFTGLRKPVAVLYRRNDEAAPQLTGA
jgi:hypothetical protein